MMFTVLPLQYCHLAAALLHFFVKVSVSGKAVRPEYRCCSILRRAFPRVQDDRFAKAFRRPCAAAEAGRVVPFRTALSGCGSRFSAEIVVDQVHGIDRIFLFKQFREDCRDIVQDILVDHQLADTDLPVMIIVKDFHITEIRQRDFTASQ